MKIGRYRLHQVILSAQALNVNVNEGRVAVMSVEISSSPMISCSLSFFYSYVVSSLLTTLSYNVCCNLLAPPWPGLYVPIFKDPSLLKFKGLSNLVLTEEYQPSKSGYSLQSTSFPLLKF